MLVSSSELISGWRTAFTMRILLLGCDQIHATGVKCSAPGEFSQLLKLVYVREVVLPDWLGGNDRTAVLLLRLRRSGMRKAMKHQAKNRRQDGGEKAPDGDKRVAKKRGRQQRRYSERHTRQRAPTLGT